MNLKGVSRRVVAKGRLHLFHDEKRAVVQLRMKGSATDPLATWIKVGVQLTRKELIDLSQAALRAASGLKGQ